MDFATDEPGAAEDRVTALVRAKLDKFQRSMGVENPMTLEQAKGLMSSMVMGDKGLGTMIADTARQLLVTNARFSG